MFVKKCWSTNKKTGKRYYNYYIAHSYRPGKGKNPRTKNIVNITPLGEELINKIAILLKSNKPGIIPDIEKFFKKSFIYGSIVFILLIIKRMGLIEILKSELSQENLIRILGIILNRILDARSKLGSVSWLKNTCYSYLYSQDKGLNEDMLYRAMDKLNERLPEILKKIFLKNKKGTRLFLYDITSVFFEGKGPEELSKCGYSRDEKPKNPQIILALALNEDKLPVYYEILEGNVSDKKTVIPIINKVKEEYELIETIFIGDRGMITLENVEYMEREGIDYILALRHREARELLMKRQDMKGIFDEKVPLEIYSEEGKRYILCGSEYRKEHDLKNFEKLLKKGRESLESVLRMVEKGRLKDYEKVVRRAQKKLTKSGAEYFYDFKYHEGKFEIIEKREEIEKARKLCGYYILKTSVKNMKESDVELNYKKLKYVEDAFRQLKGLIKIRPIFHWKERRVKSHIFLCILSQEIYSQIREVLKNKGWLDKSKENSVERALDILSEINLGIFDIEGEELSSVTMLTQEQKEIFDIEEKLFTDFNKIKVL